jgi:hypothetical protein
MVVFKKGDKVSGKYLGVYPFEGIIWHTESRIKGQNLYVELARPIFVGQNAHARSQVFVNTNEPGHEVKIMLDK